MLHKDRTPITPSPTEKWPAEKGSAEEWKDASEKPVKILLVDDKPENLIALTSVLQTSVLQRPEYKITTALSGQDALSCLLKDEFAVILLDVMMPGMDGFETATLIKAREKTRSVPIIFVTAVAGDLEEIYRGYTVGAVDYIQKPLDPDVVRAKVAVFADLFRSKKKIELQAEIIRKSERAEALEREHAARTRAEMAESRYYDLINWVDHAVLWEYDAIAHKFAFVSQRSLEILGYSPDDWLKDPGFFVNQIPPNHRERFETMLENAITLGRDGRCEHHFYKQSGETLWVHSGVNPRKDVAGTVTLLWGLTLDITGFKNSEENQRFLSQASGALTSSLNDSEILERLTRLIVPTIADRCSVTLVDLPGADVRLAAAHEPSKIRLFVETAEEKNPVKSYFKSLVDEVIQSREPKVIRADPHSLLFSDPCESNSPESSNSENSQLPMKSAMIVPLHIRERTLGAISFISCNTHRLYFENDLRFAEELAWHAALAIDNSRLYDEAEKAVRTRDDLLAVVSHDLRSPLSAILMNAQLMIRTGKGGKVDPNERARRIVNSAAMMNRLISDLLDLSKIEAGHLELTQNPLDVDLLVHEITDLMASIAEEKSVSIDLKLLEKPIRVTADHDRVLQILSNLIGNAIKFSPHEGQITVGVKIDADEVVFWVADKGPGISKEDHSHLFERYWQSEGAKKKQAGTGLGLYIARKMVQAHGGRIWASSELGQGSTFFFSLPIE
jgi:PAS domain S-box-containing protein